MGVKIQKPGEPGHPGGNRRVYVRVNYGGHRKTRVFNGAKAAERYATDVEALLKLGRVDEVFTDPAPAAALPAPTFKEAAERWLAVDGAALKPGTREDYQGILNRHIFPVLGERPLSDITRADVEDWWAGIRAKGLSHPRQSPIRTVLTHVFRRAVASGMVLQNPADAIAGRMGREDREVRQAEWLTEVELIKLLAMAREREPRYHPILLTIVSTGDSLGGGVGPPGGGCGPRAGEALDPAGHPQATDRKPQEREAPHGGCAVRHRGRTAGLD
jgi:hypothetical protein